MPSRNAIANEVKVRAAQLRATLKTMVKQGAKYHSATTDIWTDRAMRSYISLTIHFIDQNFVMNDWTLEVEPLPGIHTGKDIADALRLIYARWDLSQVDCVRLVRDGARNAMSAARQFGVESFSCIAHCIHLVVSSALIKSRASDFAYEDEDTTTTQNSSPATSSTADPDDTDDLLVYLQELACQEVAQYVHQNLTDRQLKESLTSMRETVQVFRSLAVYFKNSAKAKSRLEVIRSNVQKETKTAIALDCPTRWSSTWEMLAHFVDLQLTVTTFFAYLGTHEGKREFPNQRLVAPSTQQWFSARCLLRLLEPFGLAIEQLSGSKYPTITLTLPVLRYIKTELTQPTIFDEEVAHANDAKVTAPVVELMRSVQAALLKLFQDRFNDDDPLFLWVSMLDPRLTDLEHLNDTEKLSARRLFARELVSMVESSNEFAVGVTNTMAPRVTTPVKAKAKAKIKAAVFGPRSKTRPAPFRTTPPLTNELRCQQAIADYTRAAATVDADADPIEWWQKHRHEHPLVAQLARKYLACVATSVPSERAFSTGGNVVSIKRCALLPSMIRDMVFIAQNTKPE